MAEIQDNQEQQGGSPTTNERLDTQAAIAAIMQITQQGVDAIVRVAALNAVPGNSEAAGQATTPTQADTPGEEVRIATEPVVTPTARPLHFEMTEDDPRLQRVVGEILPIIVQWLENQDPQPEENDIVEHIREVLKQGDEYIHEVDQAFVVFYVLSNLPLPAEQEGDIPIPAEGAAATLLSDQPSYFTAPRGGAMRQLCERVLVQIRPRFGPETVFDAGTVRGAITQALDDENAPLSGPERERVANEVTFNLDPQGNAALWLSNQDVEGARRLVAMGFTDNDIVTIDGVSERIRDYVTDGWKRAGAELGNLDQRTLVNAQRRNDAIDRQERFTQIAGIFHITLPAVHGHGAGHDAHGHGGSHDNHSGARGGHANRTHQEGGRERGGWLRGTWHAVRGASRWLRTGWERLREGLWRRDPTQSRLREMGPRDDHTLQADNHIRSRLHEHTPDDFDDD